MAQNSSAIWAARGRFLGITGGILALLSFISGLSMLLMKWAGAAPPHLLSQLPLLVLPLAFVCFMLSIWCAIQRRRKS